MIVEKREMSSRDGGGAHGLMHRNHSDAGRRRWTSGCFRSALLGELREGHGFVLDLSLFEHQIDHLLFHNQPLD